MSILDNLTIKLSLEDREVEKCIEEYLAAKQALIAALSHEKLKIGEAPSGSADDA